MRAAALAVVLLASCTAACGGQSGLSEAEREREGEGGLSEEESEARERAKVKKLFPAADRIAYYQIATTSGLVRARAAAALRGDAEPPLSGRRELDVAAARIEALRPKDDLLRRLRVRLLPAVRRAALPSLPAATARRLIAATDAVNAGLARFVKANPSIAVLLPD